MTRPGVVITSRESVPARTAPTYIGALFAGGVAERGPAGVSGPHRSMSDYERAHGARSTDYAVLYDAADAFFREGGSVLYTSRAVGPAAAVSSVTLDDGVGMSPTDAITVSAASPGAWGDDITIDVASSSGGYTLTVKYDGETVETSPELTSNQDAVDWAESSSYIRVTQESSNLPVTGTTANALTGGTDDKASITDTQWGDALDAFGSDLGPGQVTLPGVTAAAQHEQLLAHAGARNRVALLDVTDSATAATVVSSVSALRSNEHAGLAQAIHPAGILPGALSSQRRTVPYSAIQAGILARNDSAGVLPNDPAAGDLGVSRSVIDLAQTVDPDSDLETLNDGGVTSVLNRYGSFVTYGLRSLADPDVYPLQVQFGAQRLIMEIVAKAGVIAERHLFRPIDGMGYRFADLQGDLQGLLLPYWTAGGLFGATAADAFQVNVGSSVNTPETIAAGELRAVITLRVSNAAEVVRIEIVRVPITTPIAA